MIWSFRRMSSPSAQVQAQVLHRQRRWIPHKRLSSSPRRLIFNRCTAYNRYADQSSHHMMTRCKHGVPFVADRQNRIDDSERVANEYSQIQCERKCLGRACHTHRRSIGCTNTADTKAWYTQKQKSNKNRDQAKPAKGKVAAFIPSLPAH